MIESVKIVLLAMAAAILYGILHDQVTARVCLEYFTVFHPPIFGGTVDPTLLALGWGVIATWWVGLPLGMILAICSRVGGLPKVSARRLVKPVVATMLVLGMLATIAGLIGYFLVSMGRMEVSPRVRAEFLRPEHIAYFYADEFTHLASYGFGALLGLGLCGWVLVRRYRLVKTA